MVQHSSGINLDVMNYEQNQWVPIQEMVFEEAKEYNIRLLTYQHVKITFQGVPLYLDKREEGHLGKITMPFESGITYFKVYMEGLEEEIPVFVYPDKRKVTVENYLQMIAEIIEEAAACFQYSNTYAEIDVSGKSRDCSWMQWNYIDKTIRDLKQVFFKIKEAPLRRLCRTYDMNPKESLKTMDAHTIRWLQAQGKGALRDRKNMPEYILSKKNYESYNVYENQMLKKQLLQLRYLLNKYKKSQQDDIKNKATKYCKWISYWLNNSFLKNVDELKGKVKISQVFRKHPLYSLWYEWFEKLYAFKNIQLGFSETIPLGETYLIYEIWAYMKIVKWLREMELIEDTSGLYKTVKNDFFLRLAKGMESKVKLKNDCYFIYQREYITYGNKFKSYTQKMIPDIVFEFKDKIVVLDPKYRLQQYIGNALADMHKYRDGIVNKWGEKCVTHTFILTPTRGTRDTEFFSETFYDTYKMGAFPLNFDTKKEDFEKLKIFE